MTVSKSLSEFLRWLVFLSYCVLLYLSYTLPADQIPPMVVRANDKLLHFFEFLLLALLAFRTLTYSAVPLFHVQSETQSAGFSLFYGAFLEWAQRPVPGRQMNLADWVADAVGVLAAAVTFRASQSLRKRFSHP